MSSSLLSPVVLFCGLILLLIGVVFSLPTLPLTSEIHHFEGQVMYLGIPAFSHCLSSLSLSGVGTFGLIKRTRYALHPSLITGLITFLISLILSGIGLAIYHWAPDNQTLLFVHLPFSAACMGLSFSLLMSQAKVKNWLWIYGLMMIYGLGSSWYGIHFNQLQIYYATQFFPLALMLLLIARIWSISYTTSLIYGTLYFGFAKVMEISDEWIYTWSAHWLNGQVLAHCLYALGSLYAFRFFSQMKPRELLVDERGI